VPFTVDGLIWAASELGTFLLRKTLEDHLWIARILLIDRLGGHAAESTPTIWRSLCSEAVGTVPTQRVIGDRMHDSAAAGPVGLENWNWLRYSA
jgi:hypothetical protein